MPSIPYAHAGMPTVRFAALRATSSWPEQYWQHGRDYRATWCRSGSPRAPGCESGSLAGNGTYLPTMAKGTWNRRQPGRALYCLPPSCSELAPLASTRGRPGLSSPIQLARRHPRDHRTVSHSPGSWAKLALRHPPDTRTTQPFIWTVGEAYPSTPTGYPDRPAITLIVGDIPGARSEPPSLGRCSLRVQVSSFFPLQ